MCHADDGRGRLQRRDEGQSEKTSRRKADDGRVPNHEQAQERGQRMREAQT
jgi:hypothetical protein